jgi:hypothetical protein
MRRIHRLEHPLIPSTCIDQCPGPIDIQRRLKGNAIAAIINIVRVNKIESSAFVNFRRIGAIPLSALRRHRIVGVMAPPDLRRKGAIALSAQWLHGIVGVKAPLSPF